MKNILSLAFSFLLAFSVLAQDTLPVVTQDSTPVVPQDPVPVRPVISAKERAKLKAKYSPFSLCPSRDLKKDTMAMDSMLVWKSFYDSLGVIIDFKNLAGYNSHDSLHRTLILISSELNSPERLNGFYEKMLNKDKKKSFSKKEMKVRNSDIISSQRSVPDEPPALYMIWIRGGDEPDSATVGEFPDTLNPNITLNEYLVWQLYNKVVYDFYADSNTSTICSDLCKVNKKTSFAFPISSFAGDVPKTYMLDPSGAGGNLSSAGPRSVKIQVSKAKAGQKKTAVKK